MIYSNLGLNITIVKQINYLPVLFQRPCQGRGSVGEFRPQGTIWCHAVSLNRIDAAAIRKMSLRMGFGEKNTYSPIFFGE